ncbi:osmoprotectant NAGGN system M42 family peptidase [Hyphobacterium sp.]|jgi:peptidase M42 family hydrolase|uniref:osmoprotectant NAGGN system M42 family peptidase n=1 Tax=Hyphobacterium sp. TaxID=2004662 RepID=UPI003BAA9757
MTTRLEIDQDYLKNTLAHLLSIPSPSGYTDAAARWVTEELERLGVETELTRRGAIRARIPGEQDQPARGIIAHIDTLGAIVRQVKDNGRLALAPIGHWSSRFAEGARATIFSEAGSFRGTILPLKASGHVYADEVDEQPVNWKQVELRIDMPIYSREDAERAHLAVGDIVAIDPQPEFFDNGFIVSRHLDDKAGAAALLAAIKALKESGQKPPVDTIFLFSISEEVGVGASSIVTHDIASMVAIDNGAVAPGQGSKETGVTIAMGDMTGPFDFHLTRKLIDLCRDNDIRFQRDHFEHYRSDNASAVEGGADIRTALITFGVDASHGYERTHIDAPVSVAQLVTAYALSEIIIQRDAEELGGLEGFTDQPTEAARGSKGHRTD